MRKYEMMLIYDTEAKPLEETKTYIKDVFKTNKVDVVNEKDMGFRDLAYLINKKSKGYYYLFNLESEPGNLIELNKTFKLYKGIMRYITLQRD